MAYTVRITRNAVNDIGTFYHNTVRRYPNTWTKPMAIRYANNIVDEMVSTIINGITNERLPLLQSIVTSDTVELYTKDKRWYYSVRIYDNCAIIENAIYKGNESNRAYRRGVSNPSAPLSLDDRVNQAKYRPISTKTSFTLPSKMKILNGEFYGGLKIGYYNRRYIILKSDGTPIVNKWFNNKPRFLKRPFGRYNIIAHVSCFKSLFAVSIDGYMYDMHRLWSDAYLSENFILLFNKIITETLKDYINGNILLETKKNKVVRLHEHQLRHIVYNVVKKIIA